LLNENDAEYLLVGGWAVGFYGYSRFTADIDIFIGVTSENVLKVKKSLYEFGVPKFDTEMLTTPGHVFRIGRTPLLIEVINEISGVNFSEGFSNKEFIEIEENMKVPIISLKDLIKNKGATERLKDKADLEFLLKILEE
jgi:hypothetical protein